jgi:anti-sigma regulatory factor (Ser/Thr protein kinase)
VKHLALEITSNLGDISLMAVAVHALSVHAGLGQDIAGLVELSIVEAVTNSIKHAYHGKPNQRLMMTMSLDEEHLQFDLYDSGDPMPPDQVDRLVRGQGIVEANYPDYTSIPETGRGLEIIHRTMDRISYTREGGQNHMMLGIRLSSAL